MTILQTTIAGSLPKPGWVAEPKKLWAAWLLEGELLEEGKRDAMCLSLADQEAAGIDIVTDGEQTRRHFVTTFIESLKGVDLEHKRTVRIRNRYDADVPVVVGPVGRGKPVFVEDVRFLRGQTKRRIKLSLPGPMTMVDTLYDNHYRSRELLALLKGKDVMVGAIDVANDTVETPEQVAAAIRSAMKFVPPEKLYPCTNCGMVPLAREVALGKLKALAAGAAVVRREIGA